MYANSKQTQSTVINPSEYNSKLHRDGVLNKTGLVDVFKSVIIYLADKAMGFEHS